MLVLSGIMDFGFMLYSRMSVINSSREGAHAAIVTEVPTQRVTMAQGSAIATASQGGVTITTSDVSVSCLKTTASVTAPPAIACDSAKAGDSIVVTVVYSYHSFFPLLVGATLNLSSTTQMVLEI
jgi:Flp pilus assembly protein TadG